MRAPMRQRRLLLSDRRREQIRIRRLLDEFEVGVVYVTCPVHEIASIPGAVLLQPGDVHDVVGVLQ
jgi:ABC-type molybdate transport system ATPase subunit